MDVTGQLEAGRGAAKPAEWLESSDKATNALFTPQNQVYIVRGGNPILAVSAGRAQASIGYKLQAEWL